MKKNNFVQGAFIASLSIIICKILGIIYVIPFYGIVGEKGGALYGYAYTFYELFTSLATIGLPFAMSKIVSEYDTLGYNTKKITTFYIGLKIISVLSVICFLVLYLSAPFLAENIIGTAKGGNSLKDVELVLRVSSISLVFVSLLSITKGYLQGHKYIQTTSISQVIEQVVRVLIIILGSYISLKVLNLGTNVAVSIAVFGACVGAIFSLIYLSLKIKRNHLLKNDHYKLTKEEEIITEKYIVKRLLKAALPFVMIAFITSGYAIIDTFTVGPTLRSLGYSTIDSEAILGNITTWGSKLLSIIQAVVTGLCVSLIPHIASSFIKKDMQDVADKINKTYLMTIYLTLPMAIGLSFLAKPVWQVFYGVTKYGPSVFSFYILAAIFSSLFLVSLIILQALNKHKEVFIALVLCFIYNAVFNIPSMLFLNNINIPAYHGATLASIVGYLLAVIYSFYVLKKSYNINFNIIKKETLKIILLNSIMLLSLFIIKLFIPLETNSRLISILLIMVYALLGIVIYFWLSLKLNLFNNVFGNTKLNSLLKKLKLIKGENI